MTATENMPKNGRWRFATTKKEKGDYPIPDFGALWVPELTYLPNGWAVAIAVITPALAEVMLAHNRDDNRNKRKGVFAKYADDMRCHRWRLTHQGVAFDRDGHLCDGQHRLTSCIAAGASFSTLVFFGAGHNQEMAVLDTGAARSATDASSYVLGERMGKDIVSVVRAFLYGAARNRWVMTHSHLLQQIDHYHAAVLFHRNAIQSGDRRYAPAPVRAAVCRAFYHADPDDLARFVAVLAERLDPSEPRDKAAKLLRRYLSEGTKGGIGRQREQFCKAQRAVAAYLGGEVIDRLFASEDDLFPLPTEAQIEDRNAYAYAAQAAAEKTAATK